jgi:hypothetical protein
LKKEQERKAAERRRIIEERCGKAKNVDDANEGIFKLKYIYSSIHSHHSSLAFILAYKLHIKIIKVAFSFKLWESIINTQRLENLQMLTGQINSFQLEYYKIKKQIQ